MGAICPASTCDEPRDPMVLLDRLDLIQAVTAARQQREAQEAAERETRNAMKLEYDVLQWVLRHLESHAHESTSTTVWFSCIRFAENYKRNVYFRFNVTEYWMKNFLQKHFKAPYVVQIEDVNGGIEFSISWRPIPMAVEARDQIKSPLP